MSNVRIYITKSRAGHYWLTAKDTERRVTVRGQHGWNSAKQAREMEEARARDKLEQSRPKGAA